MILWATKLNWNSNQKEKNYDSNYRKNKKRVNLDKRKLCKNYCNKGNKKNKSKKLITLVCNTK